MNRFENEARTVTLNNGIQFEYTGPNGKTSKYKSYSWVTNYVRHSLTWYLRLPREVLIDIEATKEPLLASEAINRIKTYFTVDY